MSLTFSTGVTENFLPRATKFWPSIREHKIPFHAYLVDFRPKDATFDGISWETVRYAEVACKVPKTQMQHGAFATHFWRGSDDDVVGFCDGDAYFQRPFTPEELSFMGSVGPSEFMAGRNNPDPTQTLEQEAQCLFPKLPPDQLARLWPGYEQMLCRNFGFVVARISTWKRIYSGVRMLWRNVERSYSNPAMVQFAALFSAYHQGIALRELPLSIHTHAHLGLPEGVERDGNGLWRASGEVIAYAHAL